MAEEIFAVLIAEDRAHELFLKPLLRRLAEENGAAMEIRVISAQGGHGVALGEYRTYQRARSVLFAGDPVPDLVVVALDGNCSSFAATRASIEEATDDTLRTRLVTACPDPHIERWYLADPSALKRLVGQAPTLGTKKCERHHYKKLLAETLRGGDYPAVRYDDTEFAPKIVEGMDLHRAGRNDHSLRDFLRQAANRLRQIAGGHSRD